MSLFLVRVMNKDLKQRPFDNVLVYADCFDQAECFAFYSFGQERIGSITCIDYEIILPDSSFIYEV